MQGPSLADLERSMTEPARREGEDPGSLARVLGLPGAVLLGLGSILGTGVFVSIGIAAEAAGAWVVPAVALAALVAACNGLSSAALAAAHPVTGGTYEYGYRFLGAPAGFLAGWMFLCAKSASAATAALGFSGYLLARLGVAAPGTRTSVALVVVVVLTAIVAGGIGRSNRANTVIVAVTLVALGGLVVAGTPVAVACALAPAASFGSFEPAGFFRATALMFVAYTGYGRIATLSEEVRDPERTIPRAIVVTLVVSAGIYLAVASVAVATLGAAELGRVTRAAAAPLEVVAAGLGVPGLETAVTLGAMTAMLSVLLNLLLGLSRVVLAMARRRDMPAGLTEVDGGSGSPRRAVVAVGALIAILVTIGDVKATWSFSAFTVLVYYAITNLAALRLPAEERRVPQAVPGMGLMACLGLAFQVEPRIWGLGLGLLLVGLVWHRAAPRMFGANG